MSSVARQRWEPLGQHLRAQEQTEDQLRVLERRDRILCAFFLPALQSLVSSSWVPGCTPDLAVTPPLSVSRLPPPPFLVLLWTPPRARARISNSPICAGFCSPSLRRNE